MTILDGGQLKSLHATVCFWRNIVVSCNSAHYQLQFWHTVKVISNEVGLRLLCCGMCVTYIHLLAFLFGSQRRRLLSLPVLTLIFPALLPCLVRDSLCTALQTKILWINWSLNAIDTIETWVSGNLTALMERSQPAIWWRVGEVANRVSCGSFRGGYWYLPFRNHDNRYFADWIRLYPGLSKNSENGNSCPKPHKAARMIEAVGRAVSIETETIIAIWILPRRSSRLYKGKLIKMRPKWTKTDRE